VLRLTQAQITAPNIERIIHFITSEHVDKIVQP